VRRHLLTLAAVILACLALPAFAQELIFLGGATRSTQTHLSTYAWLLEYKQGLSEHEALSFAYVNEGHFPYHHRDGNAAQLWWRTNLFERRLSLSFGLGPYYFYDTTRPPGGGPGYVDQHGWGGLASLSAAWFLKHGLVLEARVDSMATFSSYNTVSAVVGVGYQLAPVASPGPLARPPHQAEWTTRQEVVVYLGQTIVNSFHSEQSSSQCLEYRRGIGRYVDASVGWLNEGDSRLVRRNGLEAELWAVRSFLEDRLALGVGGGTYFALDQRRQPRPGESGKGSIDGIVTLRVAYRNGRWEVPLRWDRIVTGYDRDTDVFTTGLGYRF
jgi:hypothetical protein